MDLIETIIASVVGRVIADDIQAGLPRLLSRLVEKAASKLPPDRRQRLEEEWYSHLVETKGTLAKTRVAWGFIHAARSITEHDRKLQKEHLDDARVRWLMSEFSTQFIEELSSRPEHHPILELVRRDLPDGLLRCKYTPAFMAALAIFGRDLHQGADDKTLAVLRRVARRAAKTVLDERGKQYFSTFRIGRLTFDISRFKRILFVTFGRDR